MTEWIEISAVDTRYERCRMRDPSAEAALLAEIAARGIEEPLSGVAYSSRAVLLDGFKRHRCACRLKLGKVPWRSLGEDPLEGLLGILKHRERKGLGILEEAEFLRELQANQGLSLGELAASLSRSKGWVSMRLQVLSDLSESVREWIFRGDFPAYAYLHVVRPFMRMNGVSREAIEAFVGAVSGRGLSVREIERLAHGYFRGSAALRAEIEAGHLTLALGEMERALKAVDECSERERAYLRALRDFLKAMELLTGGVHDPGMASGTFRSEAHLVLTGILARMGGFLTTLRRFHDQCGTAEECVGAARAGDAAAADRPSAGAESKHGEGDRRVAR